MANKWIAGVMLLGAFGILISIFFLPWVAFMDPKESDRQIVEFLTNTRIQEILDRVPDLRVAMGVQQIKTSEDVRNLFTDPEIKKMFGLIRERRALTGWAVWRDVPRIDESLGWAIALDLLAALITIVWSLVLFTAQLGDTAKRAAIALGAGVGFALALTVYQIPRVDTFGLRDDFQVALMCMLTGSYVGIGVWIALIGLTLIVASQLAQLMNLALNTGSDFDSDGDAV
jgi:hypothetical protein